MTSQMLKVLVLDASCARPDAWHEIVQALRLGVKIAVPDVVFERELRGRGGERLIRRGLRVESLGDIGPAITIRRGHPCLSVGDAFALALAAANAWALLATSPALAGLAEQRGVPVRSSQWLTAEVQRRLAGRFDMLAAQRPTRVGYPQGCYLRVA